jgi:hypothetical protein
MDITEGSKRQRAVGVKSFCQRKARLSYCDVSFLIEELDENLVLKVRSCTDWQNKDTTEQMAREQIDRSKKVFAVLRKENREFSKCVKGLPVRFQFLVDYGPGAIVLAEELDGVFRWFRK